MLKSSSVTHEKEFNSTKKTNDSCDSNHDKPSFHYHIQARLSLSATHTRNYILPMSGQTAKHTNTHSNSYSSADFSITHCTLRCTIIIILKLFHDVLTKQKSSEGMHTHRCVNSKIYLNT